MKFHPNLEPFGDFLVTNAPPAEAIKPGLLKHTRVCGSITVFHSIDPDQLGDGLFLGMACLDGDMILGPKGLDLRSHRDARISSEANGQFVAVEIRDDRCVKVIADYFGLTPVFYVMDGANLSVSNRIHILVEYLKQSGKKISPSLQSLAANWFAEYSFGYQQTTSETLISGIRLMQPNEYAILDGNIAEIKRNEFKPYEIKSESDYQDIIREGAKEIQNNVLSAVNSDIRTVATLTGGKDSRAVMAAIVSLGLQKDVPFLTHKIVEKDSELSSGLVRYFGAHYDVGCGNFSQCRLDIRESISAHRSLFWGSGHDYRANRSFFSSDVPEFRMIGGCGELYRGFYQNRHPEELMKAAFSRQSVLDFLSRHKNWKFFPADFFEYAAEGLYETFSDLPGETISQKLDWHYFAFRNRFHFGIKNTMRNGSTVTYSPLVSRSLHRLSHSINHEDRLSGVVLFDVTAHMCEEAAFLPYHTPFDISKLSSSYYRNSRFRKNPPSMSPDLSLLEAAGKQRAKYRQNSTSASRQEVEEAVTDTIQESLTRLRDSSFSFLISDQLAQRVARLKNSQNDFRMIWMSRLSSLCDVLEQAD